MENMHTHTYEKKLNNRDWCCPSKKVDVVK